ncbi:MAG: hypothetical protein ACI4VN_04910 [Clostridia bacterium]
MKTKLTGIIIVVILLNAILPNFIYATDIEYDINTQTMEDMQYSEKSWEKYKEDGKADINAQAGTKTKEIRETFSLGAGLGSAIGSFLMGPVLVVSALMTVAARGTDQLFINNDGTHTTNANILNISDWSNILINWYTIEDTVFGNIDLFNADYFSTGSEISSDVNRGLKESVATWYYVLRVLAFLIGLLMLIYIGIKMAISTVASDQAKYKQMLIDWLSGMILLFLLPYIIGLVNLLCSGFVEILCKVKENVINQGFEQSILWQAINVLNITSGWSYVATVLMYLVITFYQIKFFLLYINRLLAMGFLIVISPIMAAIYPLNKTKISGKGGKSKVFSSWFKEYCVNAALQPLHAAVYLVFIVSANEIFTVAPILAVIFFATLSRAEKIVKNIFGMRKMSSIHSMSEYMPVKKLKQ